ncbi:mandelate racemase [Sphingomonas sp. Leaf23]|uniref:N-acetyl-D-Glu racemase DgcA n=1 Tax=Sphingomonas sp. Leaf23 TaxID=1735689 RepID=UPI0006F1DE7A|nr:N-acetyl-D-Glu racemase DgcA [Sphingomonas sp. Leaf23]KQM84926.1 mandelate racemase [Sphingomonas sp. Leaf23]
MLRHLDVAHDRFGLSTPFRISRGVKTAADVVTVTIAEGHVIGRGEAVPYARYGEGIEDTIAAIRAIAPALADGACRRDLATLLPAGAARNAIDCALWDLESRLAGRSVAALAGLPEPIALPSAITIGLDIPDAMACAAAKVASVPLLKIKVDRSDPAAQIAAVRAAAPSPRLIVDPNESWTIDTLQALKPHLLDWRVDLLEQPLPAGEDGALVQFDSPVPIAADEALHTAADLDRLAGRYDVVNIKLDKTGGLTEALVLARRAREKGFGLMVGCMVCSSLGIAPAMLLGAEAEFVDLDGPLWLSEDRPGGVTDDNGMLSPPAPGFWGN